MSTKPTNLNADQPAPAAPPTAPPLVNAYLRTQVLTATPEKLRLMLLEAAVRHAQCGRDGLARKDFFASFEGFSKTRDILIELMNSMRPDVDRDLCAKVSGLYTFIYQTIISASLEKDLEKANKAIELLQYECETWQLAMNKLAEERSASGTWKAAPASGARAPSTTAPRSPLSIRG